MEVVGVRERDDAKVWILQNQLGRRNLKDFQRIELAERLRPLLEARAKANQQYHGGSAPGQEKTLRQNFAEVSPVDTKQSIGDIAGVSRETVRKAEVILHEADETLKDEIRKGHR
jgi:hypothetical protein